MADQEIGPRSAAAKQPQKPRRGKNGKRLLAVTDPTGYQITLSVNCWEKHITAQHPELRTRLDDVQKTMEHPEVIQRALDAGSTYYYYRLSGRSFYRFKDVYILVVVDRDDATKTGFVKTAHMVAKMRSKGGEVIWLRRK